MLCVLSIFLFHFHKSDTSCSHLFMCSRKWLEAYADATRIIGTNWIDSNARQERGLGDKVSFGCASYAIDFTQIHAHPADWYTIILCVRFISRQYTLVFDQVYATERRYFQLHHWSPEAAALGIHSNYFTRGQISCKEGW